MRRVPPTLEILISSRQTKRSYVQLATVGRRKVATPAVWYLDTDTDTDTAGGRKKWGRRGGVEVEGERMFQNPA